MQPKTPCSAAGLAALGLLIVAAAAQPADSADDTMTMGKPALVSAGPIAFAPDGVLFVGDATGGAVFALDLGESGGPATEAPDIFDFDLRLAGLLGTTASEVLINDLAVHPKTRSVYLSVSRGRGADAQPAIVRVRGDEIHLHDLTKTRYARADLAKVPAADAENRWGQSLRAQAITDLKFHDGLLYVAGLSNEEFASSLRTLRYPFEGAGTFSTVEIFHGAHGRYETHAPIRTMLPLDLAGQPTLLASYTCTPLVTLPLESLQDGRHVKGKTVAELGFGSSPLDMVAVDNGGKTFVYLVNNRRGGMKIDPDDIAEAEAITSEPEGPLAGVAYLPMPMAGVLKLAEFDQNAVVIVQRDVVTGGLSLRGMPKRWL